MSPKKGNLQFPDAKIGVTLKTIKSSFYATLFG